MGYNNNHAGVHLIRRSGYGGYTGMAYDQSVQDEYFYKAIAEKRAQLAEKRRKRQEELLAAMQKHTATEQPSIENPTTPATDQPTVTASAIEQPANQKGQPKKNMSKNNNDFWDQRKESINNELQTFSDILLYSGRNLGTEEVIDMHHFMSRDFITKNIVIRALKERIDPVGLIVAAEELMQKDKHTNPSLANGDPYCPRMPRLEWSIVFLSIVAEKLGCSMQELFIYDEAYYKKFAYDLLDSITDNICEFDGEISDDGSASIDLGISHPHWIAQLLGNYHDLCHRAYVSSLTIEKNVYEDGEIGYVLSCGDLSVYRDSFMDYSVKGAYLHEEENGKLQEFVDKLIADHPAWTEKKYFHECDWADSTGD